MKKYTFYKFNSGGSFKYGNIISNKYYINSLRDALLQSKAIFCMGSVYLVRNETKIEQFSITSTPLPCYYQLDRRHTHDTTSVVTSKMCFIPRLFKCLITIILSVVVSTFIVFFCVCFSVFHS